MDDPLICFEWHSSTVDLLRSLLRALASMCNDDAVAQLTTDQRGYLAQAMDIAADLDIVFEEMAVALEPPAAGALSGLTE